MASRRTIVGVGKKGLRATTGFDLSRHDLGKLSKDALIDELNVSVKMLRNGFAAFQEGDMATSMNLLFKAAAVSVNVIFTIRVHKVNVSKDMFKTALKVSEEATAGIKKIMKAMVRKKIGRHEIVFHGNKKGKK